MTQPEKTPSQPNPDSKPGQPFDLEGIPIPEMSLDDLTPSSPPPSMEEPPREAEGELTEVAFPDFSFEELLKDLGETRPPQPEQVPTEVKPSAEPKVEVRFDMLDGLDFPEMQLSESDGPPESSGNAPVAPPVFTPEPAPSFNPAESVPIPEFSLDDLVEPSVHPASEPKPAVEPVVSERESDLSQFDGIELLDVRLTEEPQPGPSRDAAKPGGATPIPESLNVESVPIPEMSFDDLELPQAQPVPVSAAPKSVQPEEPVSSLDLSGLDGVELLEVRVFSMGDDPVVLPDSAPEKQPDAPKPSPIPSEERVSSLDLSGLDGVELTEVRVFSMGDSPVAQSDSVPKKQPDAPKPVPSRSGQERVSILEPGIEDLIPAVEIVTDSLPSYGAMETDEIVVELQEPGVVIETPRPKADVSPLRRQSALNPAQATAAFKSLFAQSDIPGILSLYEAQVDSRVKRLAIDWLVKHVEMLGVTPLLSVGLIETDEEMFRYMMREILKLDRGKVCKLIEVETCPPPLLQVAVYILSELGLRSALPKLQKCVEGGDAVVRSVALHGIGRSGEAAEPLIPLLLKTAEQDPDKSVRVKAAEALQLMNSRKAYEAFEQKAHEVSFEPAVTHMIEEMRAKFDPTGENRARLGGPRIASKTPEKGTSKAAGKGGADQGKAAKLAIVVLIILAAGYFLYKQLMAKG
jgi:hypothetical protein